MGCARKHRMAAAAPQAHPRPRPSPPVLTQSLRLPGSGSMVSNCSVPAGAVPWGPTAAGASCGEGEGDIGAITRGMGVPTAAAADAVEPPIEPALPAGAGRGGATTGPTGGDGGATTTPLGWREGDGPSPPPRSPWADAQNADTSAASGGRSPTPAVARTEN
jgi:hypothetical protein